MSNKIQLWDVFISLLLVVVLDVVTFSSKAIAWTTSGTILVRRNGFHQPSSSSRKHGVVVLLRASKMGRSWEKAPVSIQDELGCSPTLSVLFHGFANSMKPPSASSSSSSSVETTNAFNSNNSIKRDSETFFFDPLRLANDENFAIYREQELKHGRVAMVSVVSCIGSTFAKAILQANQKGKFQKIWNSVILASPSSSVSTAHIAAAGGDVEQQQPEVTTEVIVQIPLNLRPPVPSPLELLKDWSLLDYGRMLVFCAIIELLVWIQTDPQDMPGDYQVGYWGVRDKALHERSLICELENGRLAMMVMLYYIWTDIWKEFGPGIVDSLIQTVEIT
jgi:hypothetical protein